MRRAERWRVDIAAGRCPLDRVASHLEPLDAAAGDPSSCSFALAALDLEATRRCRPETKSPRLLSEYFLALYSRSVSSGSLEWVDDLELRAAPLDGKGSPDPVAALTVAANLAAPLPYEYILFEQLATAWAEVPFDLGAQTLDWLFESSEVWDAEMVGPAFFIARAKRLAAGRPAPALRGTASLSASAWEAVADQVSPSCRYYLQLWDAGPRPRPR